VITKLIVGSRGSKLALIQTELVIARVKELRPCPEINIKKIITTGDRDPNTRLNQIGADVFVKELEEALLDHRIDLAVHSLKDVPTKIHPALSLIAVIERDDPRDALVARARLSILPAASRIGTGSLRRSIQMARYRSDLKTCSIRGNVDTRLRKVVSGEVDGVILAAAGLFRLGWEDKITEYLPLEYFLPCAGQGALVLEARLADKDITDFLSPLNHLPTWQGVMAERSFLLTLGGGCRAPVAALGKVNGDVLKLEGMVASVDGEKVLRDSLEGNIAFPEEVGARLAHKMLEAGASRFLVEAKGQ
jgi:hydroxymethylbilane synthase